MYIVIIFAGHVSGCPPFELKIALVGIDLPDGVQDPIIINGVDHEQFQVAFKKFLWDIFAGSHHVDLLEMEIGFVVEVTHFFHLHGICLVDDIYSRKEVG